MYKRQPFLNQVVNIIYHVENCVLTRYVGDYDYFLEQHALKKRQLEAAYRKQQKEIEDLEDFIARNKALSLIHIFIRPKWQW